MNDKSHVAYANDAVKSKVNKTFKIYFHLYVESLNKLCVISRLGQNAHINTNYNKYITC